MEHIEAVPVALDEAERLNERERRTKTAGRQRARPDDNRGPLGGSERLSHGDSPRLGTVPRKFTEQLQIVAEPRDLHSEVDFRPDGEDLAALARDLANACRDQRRFPADVRPDEQDDVRGLDAGDGRVEGDGGKAGRVVGQPRLAPFEQGRPLPFE